MPAGKVSDPSELIDLFRRHPGGVVGLAEAVGLGRNTLYRFGNGEHLRFPWQAANLAAEALENEGVRIGRRKVTAERLKAMWHTTKGE